MTHTPSDKELKMSGDGWLCCPKCWCDAGCHDHKCECHKERKCACGYRGGDFHPRSFFCGDLKNPIQVGDEDVKIAAELFKGEKPVQEECNCAYRSFPHGRTSKCISPAAPVGEGWEYAWDDEFYPTKHMQWGLTVYNIKTHESATWREKAHRFITTLLAEERRNIFALYRNIDGGAAVAILDRTKEEGAKAERQRIEVAVGELRKKPGVFKTEGMKDTTEIVEPQMRKGYLVALYDVLKVVRGEEIINPDDDLSSK